MESLGLIILLSILHCQSSNETGLKSSFDPNLANHQRPLDLPLQLPIISDSDHHPAHTHHESSERIPEPHTSASTTLSRIVETKYGKVQGLSLSLFSNYQQKNNYNHPFKNKIVEVFLSLPYASPPVKSHRFSPTQTPIPWDGVKTAVKPGFVCPQVMPEIRDEASALKEMPRGYLEYLRRVEPYLRNQSEDCLYLNIFAPAPGPTIAESRSGDLKAKLRPVLVFIHGGKFSWGSGNLYDGTLLSVSADVVVVTINYRLGVLGFLNVNPSPSTKPRVANYGLMDQIAALHWLKENIAAFGGDPESITLMGYESGAASIHFLMSSPAVMEGLFHRAILIAGSAHAPWAIVEDPAAVANALADSLNCSMPPLAVPALGGVAPAGINLNGSATGGAKPSHTPDSLFDCLKNKHFSYFSKFHPPKFSVDFGPSVDGIVIRPDFKQGGSGGESQMGKRDLSPKYDLLFGISSLEMLTAFSEADLAVGFEGARRDAILRTLVRNSYRFHLNEILATITNEYIDWERSPQHPIATRDLTLLAVTDALSLAPVISSSDASKLNKSYFYVFDHSTKDGLYNYQKIGPGGGEELNYFFAYPLLEIGSHGIPFYPAPLPSNYTKTEVALCELMITHLSNFIHTGDTNEPIKPDVTWPISKERNKYRNVQWDPYDRLHQKYLEISTNKVRTRSHFRAHQMAIWLRLIPELQRSGAQYASVYHNRMRGGYNPSLYVGSLHLPQELEGALDPTAFDGELGGDFYNGTGIPPSPPTTCYSPLSSLASESASRGSLATVDAALAPATGSQKNRSESMENGSSSSPFSYTTALSVTIAIGCSFLVLNVFIFLLVYYQRDKKGVEEMMRRKKGRRRGSSTTDEEAGNGRGDLAEEDELRNYGEPPELLKANTSNATSFHHQAKQSSEDGSENGGVIPRDPMTGEGVELNYSLRGVLGHQPPCFYNDINDLIPTHQAQAPTQRPHKEVHFSPRPNATSTLQRNLNQQQTRHSQAQNTQSVPTGSQDLEIFGISTLPRAHPGQGKGSVPAGVQGQAEANHVGQATNPNLGTLPKKPAPPTRNFTNYNISQRQIFSLIMSLMTMGIL